MSAYRNAIERTALTIEQRARYFRNEVITVVVVGLLSLAWVLAGRLLAPLLGIALLLPVCGLFLFADHRVLDVWRAELLDDWVRCDLHLFAFRKAIRANPALPKETTEGMLATLPAAGDLVTEQRMSVPTRRAVAIATIGRYRSRSDAIALKALAFSVAGGGLVVALEKHRWEPLLTLVSLVLLPVVGTWVRRRRIGEARRQEAEYRGQPGFSEPDYTGLLGGLT
jgi:hypothetical protein